MASDRDDDSFGLPDYPFEHLAGDFDASAMLELRMFQHPAEPDEHYVGAVNRSRSPVRQHDNVKQGMIHPSRARICDVRQG